MIRRLALLILLCAMPTFAQVGGPTAMPPLPTVAETNQVPSADSNFSAGTFAGYSSVNGCAKVNTANPYPGDTYAAQSVGCIGGNVNLFTFSAAMHGHEAIWISYVLNVPAGFLGASANATNAITEGTNDNTHGFGSTLWSQGRVNPNVSGPSGGWIQDFEEVYINKLEHGSDGAIAIPFALHTPAWAVNHVYALNTEIVDSNGNIQEVTTAGTSGAAHPTWNTSGTTADGTGTLVWAFQSAEPPVTISHIVVQQSWFPLRNFVAQPVYRGLVWTDLPTVTTYQHGVATCPTTIIGGVCGDAEIDPPPSFTLSTVTLNVKIETSATCSGTPLYADSIASPSAVQPWEITPTQYGGVPSVGTFYYVCATLNATSGGTLLASYPPFALQFEGATYRASLISYYLPSGQWIQNGRDEFLLGTYNRLSSVECLNCVYNTGKSTYETSISGYGFGLLPSASTSAGSLSQAKVQGNTFADQSASGYTSVLSSFGTDSAISPYSGSSAGDQLTPEIAAFADYNLPKWQVYNNWMGYCQNETGVSANPSSPTGTAATGSITANYLFIQWVAFCAPITQGNSPQRYVQPTLPSTATVVNLTAAGCAGVNCGVTITTPSCAQTRQWGGLIYVGTNSTNTQPANSAMYLQYPPSAISPMMSTADYLPCGTTFTLTSLFTSGPNPSTVDLTGVGSGGSGAGRPSWATSGETDLQLAKYLFGSSLNGMCYTPTPAGSAGIYTYDEVSLYSYPFGEEEYNWNRQYCPQLPMSGVTIDNTTNALFRDMTDVPGSDDYAVLRAASPEDYAAGTSTTNSATFYTTNNQTGTSNQYFLNRADQGPNQWALSTYGDRPSWNVFQQYGSSTYLSFPYLVIDQSLWKTIIGCRVGGSLGCGALSWGNVSATGSTPNGWAHGNTQTWYDNARSFNEAKSLIPQMESPVIDSSMMNAGSGAVSGASGAQVTAVGGQQIVSNIATSMATATACEVNGNTANQYINIVNYPFGPVEWASNYFTPANTALTDIYIFGTNYCNSTFNVTFGLAAVPAATKVQVLYEGRTLNISTSGCPNSTAACFTDTWNSFDRHIYAIEQPRGAVIH